VYKVEASANSAAKKEVLVGGETSSNHLLYTTRENFINYCLFRTRGSNLFYTTLTDSLSAWGLLLPSITGLFFQDSLLL
jgi:hypothetical protein